MVLITDANCPCRPVLTRCLDPDPRKRPTIQEMRQLLEPWVQSVG